MLFVVLIYVYNWVIGLSNHILGHTYIEIDCVNFESAILN